MLDCLLLDANLKSLIHIFYFQWPTRTKTQHLYQKLLKEGNGDHKY